MRAMIRFHFLCQPQVVVSDWKVLRRILKVGEKCHVGCRAAAVWLQDWRVAGFPSLLFWNCSV